MIDQNIRPYTKLWLRVDSCKLAMGVDETPDGRRRCRINLKDRFGNDFSARVSETLTAVVDGASFVVVTFLEWDAYDKPRVLVHTATSDSIPVHVHSCDLFRLLPKGGTMLVPWSPAQQVQQSTDYMPENGFDVQVEADVNLENPNEAWLVTRSVTDGMFRSERSVDIDTESVGVVSLIVDEGDILGCSGLRVEVLGKRSSDDDALFVRLPRETFQGPQSVWVPSANVLSGEAARKRFLRQHAKPISFTDSRNAVSVKSDDDVETVQAKADASEPCSECSGRYVHSSSCAKGTTETRVASIQKRSGETLLEALDAIAKISSGDVQLAAAAYAKGAELARQGPLSCPNAMGIGVDTGAALLRMQEEQRAKLRFERLEWLIGLVQRGELQGTIAEAEHRTGKPAVRAIEPGPQGMPARDEQRFTMPPGEGSLYALLQWATERGAALENVRFYVDQIGVNGNLVNVPYAKIVNPEET